MLPQPLQIFFFTALGFESLVSHADALSFEVCLTPLLFLQVFLCKNVGSPTRSTSCCLAHPVLQLLPCRVSCPLHLAACLCPSYHLGECFFNSLAVGLPCKCFSGSSDCSLLLNGLLSFSLVVRGSEAFLPMPPSSLQL